MYLRLNVLVVIVATLALPGASFAKDLPMVKAERQGFSTPRLDRITDITQRYVDEGKLAGVITMVARRGKVVHFEVVGNRGVACHLDDPRCAWGLSDK